MTINESHISASEFKKHFLSLVDEVKNTHSTIIITKRKLPVAKVVPLNNTKNNEINSYFGYLKGYIKINEDIINTSSQDDWESNNE